MNAERDLHVEIDLAVSGPDQLITGRVLTQDGAEQDFSGWLQLLTILHMHVEDPKPAGG